MMSISIIELITSKVINTSKESFYCIINIDLTMAKREAFVYALSMKANNLSIIKSRRGWVIKKKKIPQTHLKLKKKKKRKEKKLPSG